VGVEPSELNPEGTDHQSNEQTAGVGYTQLSPQEIVSSCPDLALIILNWGTLPKETRNAILVLGMHS